MRTKAPPSHPLAPFTLFAGSPEAALGKSARVFPWNPNFALNPNPGSKFRNSKPPVSPLSISLFLMFSFFKLFPPG